MLMLQASRILGVLVRHLVARYGDHWHVIFPVPFAVSSDVVHIFKDDGGSVPVMIRVGTVATVTRTKFVPASGVMRYRSRERRSHGPSSE